MKVETSMLSLAFITAIILGFIIIPILKKTKDITKFLICKLRAYF